MNSRHRARQSVRAHVEHEEAASVRFLCAGIVLYRGGERRPCRCLLLVWRPAAGADPKSLRGVEVKCRRCDALNECSASSAAAVPA